MGPEPKWKIVFEADGLEEHEAQALSSLVHGSVRMLRLAYPAEDERVILESVRNLLTDQYPDVPFHVVADGDDSS